MTRSRLVCIRTWLVCFALVCFAGCATVRPVPVMLPLPPRPVLTPIKADAFTCPAGVILPHPWTMCITNDTYSTLANRERALRTWGLSLEAEIKALDEKAHK